MFRDLLAKHRKTIYKLVCIIWKGVIYYDNYDCINQITKIIIIGDMLSFSNDVIIIHAL